MHPPTHAQIQARPRPTACPPTAHGHRLVAQVFKLFTLSFKVFFMAHLLCCFFALLADYAMARDARGRYALGRDLGTTHVLLPVSRFWVGEAPLAAA